MFNKIEKYLVTILVIIAVILMIVGFLSKFATLLSSNKEMEHTITELIKSTNDKSYTVSKDEFRQYVLKNDSLLKEVIKANNIKVKNVTRVINNHYKYDYDTTIVMAGDSIRRFNYKPDSCVHVSGLVLADSITFDTLMVDYRSASVYWWKRVGNKGNRTFFPFGHKETHVNTINKCSGETTTEEITILKR